jgi:lipopolysaccharide biosynthesis glycosyltransferase
MLDLDTLVLGDIAPLFDLYPSLLRRHGALLAAVHDHPTHWSPRWTAAGDRFNAGVMLLLPEPALYRWLVDGLARIQYDDAMLEQAYLNAALPYMPLSLEYNTMTLIAYAEPATWARVVSDIRILHYTVPKPHRSCSEYYMAHVCKVWAEAPMH